MRGALAVAALLLAGAAAAEGFRKLEGHGGPVMGAASTPGLVATASFDNSVGLWSEASGEARWLDGHAAAVKTVAFVGSDLVASGGDDNRILLWNRTTGELVHRLDGHEAKVMSVAASPDGKLVASASWDQRIGLWDVGTGTACAMDRWPCR